MQSSQRAAFLFSCFSPASPLLCQQVWICCLLSVLTQHSSCLVCSCILWLHFWVYFGHEFMISGLCLRELSEAWVESTSSRDICIHFSLTLEWKSTSKSRGFVVQTSGSQKWDKISPQTHISLACYYEVWGVFSPCKQDQRIDAVKLWCWRRLLRVPWTARRSSQSILKEISPEYSLEGVILKLQYFGHLIWRTNSLENTLMLGNIKGRRRRGHCKPLARSPCSAWEWSAV